MLKVYGGWGRLVLVWASLYWAESGVWAGDGGKDRVVGLS